MAQFNYNQIQGVQGNQFVTQEFITEVENIAGRLGTKPEHLLAAMSFETGGSFDPAKQNKIKATGLIQFIPPTAEALGTTVDKLKVMTAVEQLKYVEKYMNPFKGKLGTLEAVYTSILSGSPKKPDDILFKKGTEAYKLNPLDWNLDGNITAAEATTIVAARLFGGVKIVQQFLLKAGFVPEIHKVGFDDGSWGKNTTDALREFQKSKGLSQTGLMNEETGFAMFPRQDQIPEIKVLARGSEGDLVKFVQDCLVKLGYMTMEKIGTGYGKFGPQTESAVKEFQKDMALNETGQVGEVEQVAWEKIVNGIKRNDPNTNIVKSIQNQLVKINYLTQEQVNTGFGIFGPQTEAAVKKLQKDNLLQESGIIEVITFRFLFNTASEAKQEGEFFVAENGENYTVVPNILMTKSLQVKMEKVAKIYFDKKGTKLVITSGYRPPNRQAPAMYNKIVKEGEADVRSLYKNKIAIGEILDAYQANKGNKDEAIQAITATIEKQVKRGTYISSHLLSNALDVRKTANFNALHSAVTQVGGRVVRELDHFHLELH